MIEAPILFFVDPPVVYSGISTQITVYVSGATAVDEVSITPTAGGDPIVLTHSFAATRGRILAVVPSGPPAGDYAAEASHGAGSAIGSSRGSPRRLARTRRHHCACPSTAA